MNYEDLFFPCLFAIMCLFISTLHPLIDMPNVVFFLVMRVCSIAYLFVLSPGHLTSMSFLVLVSQMVSFILAYKSITEGVLTVVLSYAIYKLLRMMYPLQN